MSAASHGHRPSVGRKGGGRFPHRPVWRNNTRRRKIARWKELTSARAILKTIGPGSGLFITAAKPRPMSVRLAMAAKYHAMGAASSWSMWDKIKGCPPFVTAGNGLVPVGTDSVNKGDKRRSFSPMMSGLSRRKQGFDSPWGRH